MPSVFEACGGGFQFYVGLVYEIRIYLNVYYYVHVDIGGLGQYFKNVLKIYMRTSATSYNFTLIFPVCPYDK